MISLLHTKRRLVAVAVALGVAVAGGGGATVHAAASPPPTATPAAHAAPKPGALRRSLISRADHGTLEVRRGGTWVTVTFDRGNVTAASASSITLSRPDGQSVTLRISPSTRFRGKEATSAPALKTGVRAVVVSDDGTALAVREGARALPAGH